MNSPKTLSIIIPVYNEEIRLKKTFSALKDFLDEKLFKEVQIVFVNDGSTDKTEDVVKAFCYPGVSVDYVSYKDNRGKGYAVTRGMIASKMDYALMCDADISTPFFEIKKFISYINDDKDIIIGTRKSRDAEVVVPQSIIRRNLGKVYTILANILTKQSVSDFTCGFKVFSKKARNIIFTRTIIERWSYDVEILLIAKKYNLRVFEVPVRWYNDQNTRVKLHKDILRSLTDIFKIISNRYE